MNSIENKKIFMLAAGQRVRETPGTPTVEERKLNLALILEEVYELARDGYGMEEEFQKMLAEKAGLTVDWTDSIGYTGYIGSIGSAGSHKYDPVATLDALVDIRVVADGPILSSGLQGMWEEAMDEVHRSNMSKFCTSQAEAHDTMMKYGAEQVHCNYFPCEAGYVVRRRADNKVLKSINYSPADLAGIYNKALHETGNSSDSVLHESKK